MKKTWENNKIQQDLCFVAFHNLSHIFSLGERKVMARYYILGEKPKEIAQRLKKTIQTVEQHRYWGKKKLKEAMKVINKRLRLTDR